MAETGVYFTPVDFIIFVLMLAISACTTLYYAIVKYRRQRFIENADYHELSEDGELEDDVTPLRGGLGIFVGFVSAITYLGIPAETYLNGILFWSISLTIVPAAIIINNGYLPIFFRLKLNNVFDYLELRFNRTVRLLGVLGNFFNLLVYMTVVMYGLALALSAVTRVKVWGAILSIGLVRTIFTTIGGVNAILWVDLFQVLLMIAGFLGLIIVGCVETGGISTVWQAAITGNRAHFFLFNLDPTMRHSTWSLLVGGVFLNLTFLGPNQMLIKNYRTCLSETKAKKSIWIGMLLCGLFQILAVFTGIVMYSFYRNCDPYTAGQLTRTAELLPYFIVDVFHLIPGLPGLLVSAIFAASMSSTSAGIYSLAVTTSDDFIKLKWKNMSALKSTILIKSLSCFYGLLCMCGAFAISEVNSILQTVLSWAGILGGPVLGIFTLGFFSSRTNSKGAVCGFLIGLGFGLWMFIGAYTYPPAYNDPPLSTDGCGLNTTKVSPISSLFGDATSNRVLREASYVTNSLTTPASDEAYPPIASLYSMSYLYYSGTSWILTVLVGVFVSILTKAPPEPDPVLLNPYVDIVCWCFRRRRVSNGSSNEEMSATLTWNMEKCAPDVVNMDPVPVQAEVSDR